MKSGAIEEEIRDYRAIGIVIDKLEPDKSPRCGLWRIKRFQAAASSPSEACSRPADLHTSPSTPV